MQRLKYLQIADCFEKIKLERFFNEVLACGDELNSIKRNLHCFLANKHLLTSRFMRYYIGALSFIHLFSSNVLSKKKNKSMNDEEKNTLN